MRSAPFKRALAMLAAYTAATAQAGRDLVSRFTARQQVTEEFGEYRSRGHGQGLAGNKHSARSVAQDKRDAAKRRNKGKR